KQHAEAGADDDRKEEVERGANHGRIGIDQPGDERIEINLRHPLAERPSAKDARQAARHNRARKTEPLLSSVCLTASAKAAQSSQRHTERSTEAEYVSH